MSKVFHEESQAAAALDCPSLWLSQTFNFFFYFSCRRELNSVFNWLFSCTRREWRENEKLFPAIIPLRVKEKRITQLKGTLTWRENCYDDHAHIRWQQRTKRIQHSKLCQRIKFYTAMKKENLFPILITATTCINNRQNWTIFISPLCKCSDGAWLS